MKGLSNDLQYKGGRSALRKAANIIRNTAIENAAQIDDSSTAEEIGKTSLFAGLQKHSSKQAI